MHSALPGPNCKFNRSRGQRGNRTPSNGAALEWAWRHFLCRFLRVRDTRVPRPPGGAKLRTPESFPAGSGARGEGSVRRTVRKRGSSRFTEQRCSGKCIHEYNTTFHSAYQRYREKISNGKTLHFLKHQSRGEIQPLEYELLCE